MSLEDLKGRAFQFRRVTVNGSPKLIPVNEIPTVTVFDLDGHIVSTEVVSKEKHDLIAQLDRARHF